VAQSRPRPEGGVPRCPWARNLRPVDSPIPGAYPESTTQAVCQAVETTTPLWDAASSRADANTHLKGAALDAEGPATTSPHGRWG